MGKIILISLLLNFTFLHAQDFQGYAVYESKTGVPEFPRNDESKRDISPEMQRSIEEQIKDMLQKKFILHFDKSVSLYEEEEKLENASQPAGPRMMMAILTGAGSIHYKNVKAKRITIRKEFFGKEFSINDTLPGFSWTLEPETKNIGDYICYKATATMIGKTEGFSGFPEPQGRKQAEIKQPVAETISITAWYAPDIPINQGPGKYWGLPGLILEVTDGRTTVVCSKIALNLKEKQEIKPPKGGKKVTQNEYDKIVAGKMEEMKETGGFPPRPGGFPPR